MGFAMFSGVSVYIDTRLVVASILDRFKGVLDAAGVSGYDYLEKFIQLPFYIPTELSHIKKAAYMERLFLDTYLQNPYLLLKSMEAAQKRVTQDLREHEEKWSSHPQFGDLKVLRESTIPNFSKQDEKNADLVIFLQKIIGNPDTSEDLKKLFLGKEKYLVKYSGSEKDNEEILCLAIKYEQHFDLTYSNLLTTTQEK